jgi:hypothetical protein
MKRKANNLFKPQFIGHKVINAKSTNNEDHKEFTFELKKIEKFMVKILWGLGMHISGPCGMCDDMASPSWPDALSQIPMQ